MSRDDWAYVGRVALGLAVLAVFACAFYSWGQAMQATR